jgi:hypothetical protein
MPLRIAIIICYYGRLPWYFKFFVHSCKRNSTVDFILVTDLSFADGELPDNIILAKMSLTAIGEMAEQKLSFPVALHDAYKLCDFRPAYGLIFAEFLRDYDFWGHGDIDVLYGDIRSMITDGLLELFDVISTRSEYISGFFSLYRNCAAVNNLFRESKDYKKVFQDPVHYCFDECNFKHDPLKLGKSVFHLRSEVQCMTYIVRKQVLCGTIRAYFETSSAEELTGKLEWDRGKLTLGKDKEIVLYHLIYFKDIPYLFVPDWKEVPDRIYINSFYISRFARWSFPGIFEGLALGVRKAVLVIYFGIRLYVNYLIKRITATRRLRRGKSADFDEILGLYKDEDVYVDVILANGGLCAEWTKAADVSRVVLLHRGGRKFWVKRIGRFVNIDVEFFPDRRGLDFAIHVLPFHRQRSILHKVKRK